MTAEQLKQLLDAINAPFYLKLDFWLGLVLGIAGLWFSILAFQEARAAKNAASAAGKAVKIQTITIELSEISQRLDTLDFNLAFSDARDLLNEISRRLRRLIAPFQLAPEFQQSCSQLKQALDAAKVALEEVRSTVQPSENPPEANAVYFATQGHFANINSIVAELMGLFEMRNIEVQDE